MNIAAKNRLALISDQEVSIFTKYLSIPEVGTKEGQGASALLGPVAGVNSSAWGFRIWVTTVTSCTLEMSRKNQDAELPQDLDVAPWPN